MSKGRALVVLLASLLSLGTGFAASTAGAQSPAPQVVELKLTGVIDPFLASYVERGVEAARADHAAAVLLTIDTPGGLDSSMRQIVKSILRSPVPVICYTAPSGARAASAGTFIMLACPVNAMAPGTNIGAAHPVGVSGAIEQAKVTNDAAAFIRSLAERWDRNADWAEKAVRDSVSISDEEAVKLHVVDLIAPSTKELLSALDGRAVQVAGGGQVTLQAAGATVESRKLGLGALLLHGLIDPNLAFLFFYLGLALIVIELLHPGVSIPGVLGTLMLVSAFISFGFLPVEVGGVVLLVASAAFFLLELKHPGIGLPTVGGVVTLLVGGLVLFNPSVPNARVSPWLLIAVAAGLVLFFGFVVSAAVRARRLPLAVDALRALIGQDAVVIDDLAPVGRVRANKENWTAESIGPTLPSGSAVRVVRVEGLRLIVEPVTDARSSRGDMAGRTASGSEGGKA
jgi:membrane-bound serine protease (ClpP class)